MMLQAETHKEDQRGASFYLLSARDWLFLAAVFLLPFHHKLLFYTPQPQMLERVVPAFSSIYLNLADPFLILALILSLIFEPQRLLAQGKRLRWLVIPALLLVGFTLLSLLTARLPLLTIVLAVRLLLMVGLVLMTAQVGLSRVVVAFLVSAMLNAVVGILQYAVGGSVGLPAESRVIVDPYHVPVVEVDGVFYLRVFGFTAHPNILAAFLVAAILLLLGRALSRSPSNPWFETIGTGVCAMGLALTYSRAAWAGLVLGGALLIGSHLFDAALRERLRALLYPFIAGVLVFGMLLATQTQQVGLRFSPTASQASTSDRVLLMQDAAALIRQHPLTGVGGHNFAVESSYSREITPEYSGAFRWQPVHNFTMLAATEAGIPAGLVWVWLTLAPLVIGLNLWRRKRLDSLALGWLSISLMLAWNGLWDHFVWSLPEGIGLMWLVWAGIGLSLPQGEIALVAASEAETEPISQKPLAALMRRRIVRDVLAAFAITRVMVGVVTWAAARLIPLSTTSGDLPQAVFPGLPVLDGLVRWNSFWTATIAQNGYALDGVQTNLVFLPGYPLLIKAVSFLIGDIFTAGLLIANLAFLGALAYLYALVQREFDHDTAARAVFYIAAAPAAIFFSAMYAESLALLFISAAFYYARQSRWGLAALGGALAAATHPAGFLLIPALLVEALHQQNVRLFPPAWTLHAAAQHVRQQARRVVTGWRGVLTSLATCIGPLSYALYLGLAFGEPLGFFRAQASWGRDFSGAGLLNLPAQTIAALPHTPALWLDIAIWLLFSVLAVLAFRRARPMYGVYLALGLLAILWGGSLTSTTRYALLFVPGYFLLAEWGERPGAHQVVVGIFLPLMALLTALFTRWYWIG